MFLGTIVLEENKFTGTIPPAFGNMPELGACTIVFFPLL
jgi:hypothetical protein